jgi:hypothetical protein
VATQEATDHAAAAATVPAACRGRASLTVDRGRPTSSPICRCDLVPVVELDHARDLLRVRPRHLRYLTADDQVRVVWPLKNGRPAHVLTPEERARGGRARAAKAAARKENLRYERRGSLRLIEAAQRLGEMLRSEDLRTAEWADSVVSKHILSKSPRFDV